MKYHGKKIKAVLRAKDTDLSYREIAEKHKVSIGSISVWAKEYDVNNVRRKNTQKPGRPKALASLTSEVMIAAAKMSRYDTGKLVGLLSPFFQSLQEMGGKGNDADVSMRTLQRVLDAACVGKGYQVKKEWHKGTLVLHSVPITWRQEGKKELRRDRLLCIAERHTGFAYFHAYTQVKDASLYMQVGEFAKRYQGKVTQVIVATEQVRVSETETKRLATVIGMPHNKLRKQLLDDRTELYRTAEVKIGTPTKRRLEALPIPGNHKDMDSLNKQLHKAADLYNREKRQPFRLKGMKKEVLTLAPIEKLWLQVKRAKKRETFMRNIRFSETIHEAERET